MVKWTYLVPKREFGNSIALEILFRIPGNWSFKRHVCSQTEFGNKIGQRFKIKGFNTPLGPLKGGIFENGLDRSEIQIREMTGADIRKVVEIEKDGQSSPWSAKQFYDEVRSIEVSKPIVAEVDGEVVGFAVPWFVVDEIYLTDIGVDPRFRKQGIATDLMRYVFQKGWRGEFRRIHLEVRRSNSGAIAFYHKLGFVETSIRERYYPDTHEDAILMVYHLDASHDFAETA
jgi:ribosomal-protein-alanine N-acetyltransferase